MYKKERNILISTTVILFDLCVVINQHIMMIIIIIFLFFCITILLAIIFYIHFNEHYQKQFLFFSQLLCILLCNTLPPRARQYNYSNQIEYGNHSYQRILQNPWHSIGIRGILQNPRHSNKIRIRWLPKDPRLPKDFLLFLLVTVVTFWCHTEVMKISNKKKMINFHI